MSSRLPDDELAPDGRTRSRTSRQVRVEQGLSPVITDPALLRELAHLLYGPRRDEAGAA